MTAAVRDRAIRDRAVRDRAGPERAASERAGRLPGTLAVAAATALWGLGGTVASRLFSEGVRPLELVEARTVITLLGLTGLLALTRPARRPGSRSWTSLRDLLAYGAAIAVANTCLFLSIKHLPVAVAMVLQNLAPVLVIGLTLAAARRRPDLSTATGLLLALLGVALVVRLPATGLAGIDLAGLGFGLLTAVGVAAFSVFGGRAAERHGAIRANTYAFGVATALWLVVQAPRGAPDLLRRPEQLGGVLVVGVLGTLAPFLLYAWGTARVGPRSGALNISLEPAYSAAIAWMWLGQALDTMQVLGGLVLVGAIGWLEIGQSRLSFEIFRKGIGHVDVRSLAHLSSVYRSRSEGRRGAEQVELPKVFDGFVECASGGPCGPTLRASGDRPHPHRRP